uniref:(northern house mosquito) hypothetical protein n=1 Tax=Culex pipiens TaxID=7175 RepID=A0A8D8J5E5_CULPI
MPPPGATGGAPEGGRPTIGWFGKGACSCLSGGPPRDMFWNWFGRFCGAPLTGGKGGGAAAAACPTPCCGHPWGGCPYALIGGFIISNASDDAFNLLLLRVR